MKTDVLDGMDVIRVCKEYSIGTESSSNFPFDLESGGLTPVYTEMNGWKRSLGEIDTFEELPGELADYIAQIENAVSVPIDIISLGPDRSQTLRKSHL
jgi:adenylosuccinate synthase